MLGCKFCIEYMVTLYACINAARLQECLGLTLISFDQGYAPLVECMPGHAGHAPVRAQGRWEP